MRTEFEHRVLVLFAAAIVLVAAIAAPMWKASRDALEAGEEVSRALRTLDALADARADLYAMESSVRGFLVSGNPQRLSERDAAKSSLEGVLDQLKMLVRDAEQMEQARSLRRAIDTRMEYLARNVEIRQNDGLDAVREHIARTPTRETGRADAFAVLDRMESHTSSSLYIALMHHDANDSQAAALALAKSGNHVTGHSYMVGTFSVRLPGGDLLTA